MHQMYAVNDYQSCTWSGCNESIMIVYQKAFDSNWLELAIQGECPVSFSKSIKIATPPPPPHTQKFTQTCLI